ncbi:MAG: hypothetical protein ACXW2T_02345 [Allosphingosinicella sp.]
MRKMLAVATAVAALMSMSSAAMAAKDGKNRRVTVEDLSSFTPPDCANESDDGLLTATGIAQLNTPS